MNKEINKRDLTVLCEDTPRKDVTAATPLRYQLRHANSKTAISDVTGWFNFWVIKDLVLEYVVLFILRTMGQF
jgi:hypothetical protein